METDLSNALKIVALETKVAMLEKVIKNDDTIIENQGRIIKIHELIDKKNTEIIANLKEQIRLCKHCDENMEEVV